MVTKIFDGEEWIKANSINDLLDIAKKDEAIKVLKFIHSMKANEHNNYFIGITEERIYELYKKHKQ